MNIELTPEQRVTIINADRLYVVMQGVLLREEMIDQEKEHFWVVSLDINNRLLHVELISLGSYTSTVVEPMNAFRVALIKGSIKVILAHNHPGGNLKPSTDDKEITDRLIQVGIILNVPVYDHLIISTTNFYSFRNSGLLAKLETSTKWLPQYQLIAHIKAQEKKIREEAVREALEAGLAAEARALEIGLAAGTRGGIMKRQIEIAKEMKDDGEFLTKIIKYSGLTAIEIESF